MISKSHFNFKKDETPNKKCFCRNPELIENYENAISDITQIWECHHRRELEFSKKELIALGLYYDRPPEELIFLTPAQHRKLHHKGKHHSEEHRAKISAANKGRTFSEEWKSKLSESHKGKQNCKGRVASEETKRKLSESHKGKHWKLVDGKRVWY